MIIIQNEYFSIKQDKEILFIQVFKKGFAIKDFDVILRKRPQISITKFLSLKGALESPAYEWIEFGRLKNKFELSVSSDNLEVKITINLDDETFEMSKEIVKEELLGFLQENHIVYGIVYDVINKELKPNRSIVVAKGLLPERGNDAQVIYIELPEVRPTLQSDGSVNYYEMNLFRYVHKGDWLGEKILATKGKEGMNVKGEPFPGVAGKDKPLRFDRESVEAVEQGNRIVLRAKRDGAVQIKGSTIAVINHLNVKNNVGYETGNIHFDGSVTIHGSVEDGFSVVAENDIEILGEMGIGVVEHICSKSGNIYIKGGISGQGKAIIEAGKSVFVKYANTCQIKAKEIIDIGYYALDSRLEANVIRVRAKSGRTIGGSINAKTKVALRMVGNVYEKETCISVEGFDRAKMKKQLDDILAAYKDLQNEVEKNERELKIYENTLHQFGRGMSEADYECYKKINQDLLNRLNSLEEEREKVVIILKSKGEGEVTIYEKAFPKTLLQIKNFQKRIHEMTAGTFYVQDNEMKFI